jgi:hypothetical protein
MKHGDWQEHLFLQCFDQQVKVILHTGTLMQGRFYAMSKNHLMLERRAMGAGVEDVPIDHILSITPVVRRAVESWGEASPLLL